MVEGMMSFRKKFAGYEDCYTIIGGAGHYAGGSAGDIGSDICINRRTWYNNVGMLDKTGKYMQIFI